MSLNVVGTAVVAVLFTLALCTTIYSYLLHRHDQSFVQWVNTRVDAFATQLWGALATALVITLVLLAMQRSIANDFQRQGLVATVGGDDNLRAVHAVDVLQDLGWLNGDDAVLRGARLNGGNLAGANFTSAYLHNVDFEAADLRETQLGGAKLHAANLRDVNLQAANLRGAALQDSIGWGANLRDADLRAADLRRVNWQGADLRGADLQGANLQDAFLGDADLRGANLAYADLTGATLADTQLDETTVLPDAELVRWESNDTPVFNGHWEPAIDITRYTDPTHPHYWQPEWTHAGYLGYDRWVREGRLDDVADSAFR